jgi:hypothetical protein
VGWFRQIWYGLAQAKRKSCCGLAQQILLWAGRKFVWANCDKKNGLKKIQKAKWAKNYETKWAAVFFGLLKSTDYMGS